MNNDRGYELDDFESSDSGVIDTSSDLDDGQNKCEKCGSTEISVNPDTGNLRCHFCRHEQQATKAEKFVNNISQLEGQVIGSGASDIIADESDQLTFKCSSCASEVVIDTSEAQQARCHWCRNTLSVNQQIPNGAVPDKVLPFSVKRDDAVAAIEKFVGGRKVFASKTFKADFTTENVMGVYLPYMVIDVNSQAGFDGEAEHVVNTYKEVHGNIERTFEDVDTYRIIRDFDLTIEDLTVEASSEKLKYKSSQRTNNIVNAINPFDTENSVTWDANYLTRFSSQKRDVNVEELTGLVQEKANDIATDVVMSETMTAKSQGVEWLSKSMEFKGKQWRSAYLPVWIYSYQQEKSGGKDKVHYVAVNGRTQKTMGSVPLDVPMLLIASVIIAVVLGLLMFMALEVLGIFIGGILGVVFFAIINGRYRNANASHDYVRETTRNMSNLISNDTLIRQERGILVSERRLDDPRDSNRNQHQNQNQRRRTSVGAGAAVAATQAGRGGGGRNAATSNRRQTGAAIDNKRAEKAGSAQAAKARSKSEAASGGSRDSRSSSANRSASGSSRSNSANSRSSSSSSSRSGSSSASRSASSSSRSSSSSASRSASSSSRSSSSSASRSASSSSRSSSSSASRSTPRSSSSSSRSSGSSSRSSSSRSSSSSSSSRGRNR